MKIIDLHSHTNCSDGTYTPTQLVDYANEKGLSALAITDHDTIDGLAEAKERATSYADLEIISGIELSTNSDICRSDIHILGYYMNAHDPDLITHLKTFIDSRTSRNKKLIQMMQDGGLNITLEDVLATSADGVITRAHFAKAMVNLGIVKSITKAFDKYIGDLGPYYVERDKVTQQMAIEIILKNGGVPVLAHPVLYKLSLKALDQLVSELVGYGLVGIEGIYTTYKTHETQYIKDMALKYNLIITGGSDFHGGNKPGIDLATGFGSLRIPYPIRDQIYAAHLKILNNG